tara:strand:+ start:1809 stop:2399 length:591 start_codon:yes stop_codon:yes gene_type:complete
MDNISLRYNENHQTRFMEDVNEHYIEGYATIFDNVYHVPQEGWHETISRSAFDKSIASGQVIEIRYNHSQDHVLDRSDLTAKIWNDGIGVKYRTKYNPDDPDYQKVKAKIASGLIGGSSMAFLPTKYRWKRSDNKDVLEITEGKFFECGPVNNPCNPEATANVRNTSGEKSPLQSEYKNWKRTQDLISKIEKQCNI